MKYNYLSSDLMGGYAVIFHYHNFSRHINRFFSPNAITILHMRQFMSKWKLGQNQLEFVVDDTGISILKHMPSPHSRSWGVWILTLRVTPAASFVLEKQLLQPLAPALCLLSPERPCQAAAIFLTFNLSVAYANLFDLVKDWLLQPS